jgi:hypothetical protein
MLLAKAPGTSGSSVAADRPRGQSHFKPLCLGWSVAPIARAVSRIIGSGLSTLIVLFAIGTVDD